MFVLFGGLIYLIEQIVSDNVYIYVLSCAFDFENNGKTPANFSILQCLDYYIDSILPYYRVK